MNWLSSIKLQLTIIIYEIKCIVLCGDTPSVQNIEITHIRFKEMLFIKCFVFLENVFSFHNELLPFEDVMIIQKNEKLPIKNVNNLISTDDFLYIVGLKA